MENIKSKVYNVEVDCPFCSGRGYHEELIKSDYHEGDTYQETECKKCNGNGYLVVEARAVDKPKKLFGFKKIKFFKD